MSSQRVVQPKRARGGRATPLVVVALVLFAWVVAPAVRAVTLVGTWPGRSAPNASTAGLPVRDARFTASDGVHLAGWLALRSPDAPTIILVHGFKGSRVGMLVYARYLYAAGYNVLLYDG